MVTFDKKTFLGFAVFGLVSIAVVYVLFPLGFVDFFTDPALLTKTIAEQKTYAVLIFIGLQILQVIAAPVPGEVTGFVGGVFFGTAGGVLYSTIGLTAGSWLAFSLSRIAGRPLVEKIVSPDTIKRYDYVMKHRGLFLAFLLFLIPGFPKDILCYILGLGHMGHRDFLIVSTSGRLLGTILLTLQGQFFRNKDYHSFFLLLGLSLAVILAVMVFRTSIEKWFRGMRKSHYVKMRLERAKQKKQAPEN